MTHFDAYSIHSDLNYSISADSGATEAQPISGGKFTPPARCKSKPDKKHGFRAHHVIITVDVDTPIIVHQPYRVKNHPSNLLMLKTGVNALLLRGPDFENPRDVIFFTAEPIDIGRYWQE